VTPSRWTFEDIVAPAAIIHLFDGETRERIDA